MTEITADDASDSWSRGDRGFLSDSPTAVSQ